MIFKINIKILLTSLIMMSISACKKDSTSYKNSVQLLSQGSWTLVTYRYNFNNGVGIWTDGLATFLNCQKDNKSIFYPNLTWVIDEGLTKCNSSDPQIFKQGTWLLIENETKLFSNDPNSKAIEITQLDETNFKTTRRDTIGSNITITEANYIH